MLEAGRRRVAFLNRADPTPATLCRLAGYRRAVTTWNLLYERDLVRVCGSEADAAHEATRTLLAAPNPPDGLLCFDDELALGAYQAVLDAGLEIPSDVAVVAFDHHEAIAPRLRPALSTIALPHYEMGRLAAETLVDVIRRGDDATGGLRRVACPYRARQSV